MSDQTTIPKPDEEPPLVTFALFAYNQEKYIQEAVAGALAQTYSPLQIILSDDCSSDRTFGIMQEMVEGYSGPHEIVLNKNQHNLGVGGHVNRIMELADGELIVAAAGDDISVDSRTAVLVDYWLLHGRPAALCSDCYVVDEFSSLVQIGESWLEKFSVGHSKEKSALIEDYIETQKPALLGCTEAWSIRVFDYFGELSPQAWFEDNALSLRAWIMGGIVFIPVCLVYYRQHSNNICHRKFVVDRSCSGFKKLEIERSTYSERWVSLLRGYCLDTDTALKKGLITSELAKKIHVKLNRKIHYHLAITGWWHASLYQRLRWIWESFQNESAQGFWLWAIPRLIPLRLFLVSRSSLSRLRGYLRSFTSRLPVGQSE